MFVKVHWMIWVCCVAKATLRTLQHRAETKKIVHTPCTVYDRYVRSIRFSFFSGARNLCSWELAPCSRASGPLDFPFLMYVRRCVHTVLVLYMGVGLNSFIHDPFLANKQYVSQIFTISHVIFMKE